MIIRNAYIEKRKSLDDSGVYDTKITLTKSITAFDFIFRAANGASGNRGNRLVQCISKIELVDGGKTLVSVTGQQIQANHFYEYKKPPYGYIVEQANLYQQAGFRLPFGRFFGDKVYAFDPTKFDNPEIKVTFNLAAVRAVAATAFATGTLGLTIIAHVFQEEEVAPVGMLTLKQVEGWTSAATGDYKTDLPVDFPYRRLIIRAYKANTLVEDNISNVKLSLEQGDIIPFDIRVDDFYRIMHAQYGPIDYMQQFYAQNGDILLYDVPTENVVLLNGEITDEFANLISPAGGSAQLSLYTHAGAAVATRRLLWAKIHGLNFHHTIAYDFGNPQDPETWFPADTKKDIDLINTLSATSVAMSVVLQQERKY